MATISDKDILAVPYAKGDLLDAKVLQAGEVVYDTSAKKLRFGDGVTYGGIHVATGSDAGDHSKLTNLDKDDHLQYVHTEVARTVNAIHRLAGGVNLGESAATGALVSGKLTSILMSGSLYGHNSELNMDGFGTAEGIAAAYFARGHGEGYRLAGITGQGAIGTAAAAYDEIVGGAFLAGMFQTGTATNVVAVDARHYLKVAGTATNVFGVRVPGGDITTGIITNRYGVFVGEAASSGIENNYGLYVADIASGSNKFALYTNAGRVRLGDATSIFGTLTANQNLYTARDIMPTVPNLSKIGSLGYPFLEAHISEMWGTRYVEETITVAGGHTMVVKSSAVLTAALATQANGTITTMRVDKGLYSAGDYLMMSEPGLYEVARVVSVVSTTELTVERGVDGSTPNAWAIGTVVANIGHGTAGWLEMVGGDQASFSVWTWTGNTWADRREGVRLGDLVNLADYGGNHQYGIFIGDYASNRWLSYDPVNSLRIHGSAIIEGTLAVNVLEADSLSAIKANTGYLLVDDMLDLQPNGVMRSGASGYDVGTGFWLDHNNGTPRLFIGNAATNKLTWDGTTFLLRAGGGAVTINNEGLRIGGTGGAAMLGGEVYDVVGGALVANGDFGLRFLDVTGVPRISLLTRADGNPFFRLGANNDSNYLEWSRGNLTVSGTVNATDGTLGTLAITGTLTIGTSGQLIQGTGTLAGSDFTGIRLWRDGGVGRIGGYNTGQLQWYGGTDGKLYAGGQGLWLSYTGLHLLYDASNYSYSQIMWSGTVGSDFDERASIRVWDLNGNGRANMAFNSMHDYSFWSYSGDWFDVHMAQADFYGNLHVRGNYHRRSGSNVIKGSIFVPLADRYDVAAFASGITGSGNETWSLDNTVIPQEALAVALLIVVRGTAASDSTYYMLGWETSGNDSLVFGQYCAVDNVRNQSSGVLPVKKVGSNATIYGTYNANGGTLNRGIYITGYYI